MDLESMDRKELQALCKKHGIPANTKNSQMIESLSSILQDKVKPKGCLKGSGGSSAEDLGVSRGGSKKVTFAIEDEGEDGDKEFVVNPVGKSKRKSVGRRSSVAPKFEEGSGSEGPKNAIEVPQRTTRSRGLAEAVLWSPVIVKKKMKKSGDGTEGVRQNAGAILGKEKKGISRVAPKFEEGSGSEGPKNAIEVPQRTTRSRGLAEAVLWSPVIVKKKMKKSVDGTEGVRQNAGATLGKEKKGISGAVPTTRSLRNRMVTVGGDEEGVTDQIPRRTRKIKDSVEKEENEKVAALQEDEAVGRRNLCKRSRDAESVEDEPPRRRSTRSHVKVEEAEAVEEADVGRSRKRRKGGLEVSVMEKVADEETERVSKPGGNAKRLMGNASGDANDEAVATFTSRSTRNSSGPLEEGDAVRKGKPQKQVKARASNGGDSVNLLTDSKVLAEPVRRSTHSSSTLPEDGTSLPVATFTSRSTHSSSGVLEEGDAVRKGKSQKQAKARASKGGDSVNLLTDSEVLAEPVRRSTRSSSTLPEGGTSLPAAVKSVKGGMVVRKGKSLKQAKGSKREHTTTSVPDMVLIARPIRRSSHSSSSLLENGASIPVVGKSVEEGEVVATLARRSTRSSFKPLEIEMRNNEAFTSHKRRDTRSSSELLEAEMPNNDAVTSPMRRSMQGQDEMLNNEAITSPTGRSIRSSSKLLEVQMPINESVTSPMRKSIRSSLKLLEDEMPSNEAVSTPTRRLTRSSSKMSEDETFSTAVQKLDTQSDTVIKDSLRKQRSNSALKQGDSTAPLLNCEAVSTPARTSARSSSKLVADEIPNKIIVTAPRRRSSCSSLKLLDDEMLDNESVAVPKRRPALSSSKMLTADTSSAVVCKLDVQSDAVRKDKSGKQPKDHISKQVDSTPSLSKNDAVITPSRRSTCSSSKLFEDGIPNNKAEALRVDFKAAAQTEHLEVYEQYELLRRSTRSASKHDESSVPAGLLTVSNEILGTNKKKKRTREAASKEDAFVVERETIGGSGYRRTLQVSSTSSRRKSLRKVPADLEVVQRQCSLHSSSLSENDKNVSELQQSPVNVQLQIDENGTSLVGTPKDLEDVCFGSHIREKQSSFREMENEGRDSLSLNFIEDSLEIQGNVYGEPMCSNIDIAMEAEGPLELYGDAIGEVLASVELTSSAVKASSGGTSVGALDDVAGVAGMESQNITSLPVPLESYEEPSTTFHTEISIVAPLKEPDSAVEIVEREDMVTGYEEAHVSSPRLPHKSSAELSLTSNTEASPGIHLEGPHSPAEIHDSTENALDGNEATDIREPTFVCKGPELFSPSSNSEASPVTDLKEPVSKVEANGPCEDISADSGATKVMDPTISNTEVCPKAFCDINAEELNSKVEGSEDTNTAGSPLSCKSTGVLLPTLLNEVSDIDLGESVVKAGSHDMSKVASYSNNFLYDASDNHSKTLKDSTTADWDALYLSDIQRMFDNETENCLTDQDNTLNSQPAPGECDAGKKIESPPGNSDSLSCEAGLEVVKETWVSSTLSITVSDGIETEEEKNDAEKKGDELRSSSLSENPVFDLCSDDHLKEHERQSSEEIVDRATALCSHGGAKQSDFTQSLCDNDPVGVDGNSRDFFYDEFCEDNSNRFLSPVTFVEPEENEFSHSKIGVSSEIREEKWNVEHGSSIQSLASGSKSVKQMVKEDRLLEVDLKPTGFSASTSDNISHTDAVLFGGVEEVNKEGDLPTVPISLAGSEEILPISITGVPTSLGYEGSTKHVGVQNFPCIPDSEDIRHLSDQQEITVNVTENLRVDSADRSPKLIPKAHDTARPLNVVAYVLPETVDDANELTDMEFERSLEAGAVITEETENIEFLKSDTSIEGGNDTVMKMADSIGRDKFNHVEVGWQKYDAYLLQETDALSGEHHTDDIASRPFVENSASIPEETLLSLGNFGSSTHRENESNDEKESGAKTESRLPCNIHEGFFAALGESNEEERAQVSLVKPECILEATMIGEQHTTPTSESTCLIVPTDSLNCKEAGLCKEFSLGDNGLKGVYSTALSEPRNEDGVNAKNDDVELKESLDLNTNIASNEKAEEHGADHGINMSCGMAQDSEVTGISENIEASPAADSSSKVHTQDEESNKNQGTLESFGQASNVEEVWVAPGATLMVVEELFHMDSRVGTSVNDSAPVGQLGHHGENLAHKKWGRFSEINISEALAIREWEMKAIAVSGSSDAETEEDGLCKCEMSSENISGGDYKPCKGMESQGTCSTEQSEGQEEIIVFSQEKISEASEGKMFALLDGTKLEGSAIVESKLEETEITPATAVAKKELSGRDFTTLSVTDTADQVLLWDRKESMETSVGNELEDSNFRVAVSAQHALISLDSEAARDSSTATQEESIVSKDEIMTPEEYLEDFWSFADAIDVGNSHQEVRAVDSQLPVESTIGNSSAHSSKSGIDMDQEQSKSSEFDQIEESKECVQSTPMQLVRNFESYSVIDDVIRNKENTVGLKMDSTQKHNDKSVISNSSRRPLQSVRRDMDEH